MKFCFFGYDHTLDVMQRLMDDGHEAVQVFTFKCDNHYSYNKEIKALCAQQNIPITQGRMTDDNITTLIDKGCELFLSSGYPYKIPPIDENKAYGLNIHPTLLPRARGIMPQPYVIMDEPEAAGFTIHKLTQDYDAGDILFQKATPLDDTTDIETLAARISVNMPAGASEVVNNIETYWKEAKPQNPKDATYYNEPDTVFRTLHWNDPVETLLKKGRAFGRYGVFANVTNRFGQNQKLAVFAFNGWKEQHNHEPGTLIRSFPREITIAVNGGFLCLKEFSPIRST